MSARAADRDGFALVMVVLLLFAVAVAGATGYQIVSAENELATANEAGEAALAVARAGVERYVGEHIGVPGATTTYALGAGTVVVTQKRLLVVDTTTDVWMIEAVGTLPDPRYPSSPTTRTVRQFARLHKRPVNQRGAVIWNTNNLRLRSPVIVAGSNGVASWPVGYPTTLPACVPGLGPAVFGTISIGAPNVQGGAILVGGSRSLASSAQIMDTAAVTWSAIQDMTFPIPLDGSWPNFGALPADSFPVIRVSGDITLDYSKSGRGALIVTGNANMGAFFSWSGIILAGSSTEMVASSFLSSSICGMLVTGLDGTQGQVDIRYTAIQYQEYAAVRANRSLAYFELLDGTRWEF